MRMGDVGDRSQVLSNPTIRIDMGDGHSNRAPIHQPRNVRRRRGQTGPAARGATKLHMRSLGQHPRVKARRVGRGVDYHVRLGRRSKQGNGDVRRPRCSVDNGNRSRRAAKEPCEPLANRVGFRGQMIPDVARFKGPVAQPILNGCGYRCRGGRESTTEQVGTLGSHWELIAQSARDTRRRLNTWLSRSMSHRNTHS